MDSSEVTVWHQVIKAEWVISDPCSGLFLVDNISGMSGGRRCPPFEDGHRKNTGQRQQASAHDFRVPAEATANWLQRTTYQIDNNAVAGNLLMTSISNYAELLVRQFQRFLLLENHQVLCRKFDFVSIWIKICKLNCNENTFFLLSVWSFCRSEGVWSTVRLFLIA